MIPLSTRREDDLLASIVTMRLLAERMVHHARTQRSLTKATLLEVNIVSGQSKLTWLALGEDQAARSRRVEQLTAL